MKIMLVEDDQKLVNLVEDHLTRYGYEVVVPSDLQNVMAFFEQEQPELILMDVNLPFLTGIIGREK